MDWARRLREARLPGRITLTQFGAICAKQEGGERLSPETWAVLAAYVNNGWMEPGPRSIAVFEAACRACERGKI